MEKKLILPATDESLKDVLSVIEESLEVCGCSMATSTQLMIAVEEIFVNIAHYAYEGAPGEAIVNIFTNPEDGLFRVVFRDHGIPYNPLEKEDPDITLSAEERGIGGLGIFMVKQMMDRVDYVNDNGDNVFTIEKKFK